MSDRQQEAELRARFDAQRRVDADAAPPFRRMLARARAEAERAHAAAARVEPAPVPRRPGLRRLVVAGGLAAAAAVAALLVIPRSRTNADAFERAVHAFQTDPALGAWQSPTAGLLAVPGLQLMSTVPSVGRRQ